MTQLSKLAAWTTQRRFALTALIVSVLCIREIQTSRGINQGKNISKNNGKVDSSSSQLRKSNQYEVGKAVLFETFVNDLIDQKLSYIIWVGLFLFSLVIAAVIGVAVVSFLGQRWVRFYKILHCGIIIKMINKISWFVLSSKSSIGLC